MNALITYFLFLTLSLLFELLMSRPLIVQLKGKRVAMLRKEIEILEKQVNERSKRLNVQKERNIEPNWRHKKDILKRSNLTIFNNSTNVEFFYTDSDILVKDGLYEFWPEWLEILKPASFGHKNVSLYGIGNQCNYCSY